MKEVRQGGGGEEREVGRGAVDNSRFRGRGQRTQQRREGAVHTRHRSSQERSEGGGGGGVGPAVERPSLAGEASAERTDGEVRDDGACDVRKRRSDQACGAVACGERGEGGRAEDRPDGC